MRSGRASLIGRASELAALNEILLGPSSSGPALTIVGPPGIGKTSLWLAASEAAQGAGLSVLTARASTEEHELDFAGLSDLLEGAALDRVPPPARRALECVLLRDDDPAAVELRAVYAGVLAVMRELSAGTPILIAIDDIPWLDHASARALAFAARRTRGTDVRFLFTAREPEARAARGPLELALHPEQVSLSPLGFDAIARLITERHEATFSRATMRRIHEAAAGNPLFALELGRQLAVVGGEAPGIETPLPSRVEELLASRVAALGPGPGAALLAAALSLESRLAEIVAVVGETALEEAVRVGVLSLDGTRVRLGHPMLGEVAKSHADVGTRRDLHRRMAAVATDEELRALHLARAAWSPDPELAATVAAAAALAARRGAVASALELGEHALALTPEEGPDYLERVLDVADYNSRAGQFARAAELLAPNLDSFPAGSPRARGKLLLAHAGEIPSTETLALLEQAAVEAPEDSPLRADARRGVAFFLAVALVARLAEAEPMAAEAVAIATAARDTAAEHEARATLAWVRTLRGRPIQACPTGGEDPSAARVMFSPERAEGVRMMWRGELGPARRVLEAARDRAEERGESESYVVLRLQLCELELRAGRWDAVETMLAEWRREHDELVNRSAALARCQALLAAGRGDVNAAAGAAGSVIALADARQGARWHCLEALRASGIAELLAGDAATAVQSLSEVWDYALEVGVEDPGVFPVAPDLVEALALVGELEQAWVVIDRLERLAVEQDHSWGLAAVAHGRGLVLLHAGDANGAERSLAEAVERFERLGMEFAWLRSLTALGIARRRLRQIRAARAVLEQAVAGFERLGSPGWARHARSELSRVGGRRSAGTELTPTERRVAELVAEGYANKRVAAELVIGVGAVEAHLTRVFAKLGIRSRTELATRFSGGTARFDRTAPGKGSGGAN